jgi:selenocysteine lyase/cysteine desulfurase
MTAGTTEFDKLRQLRELLPATGAGIYLDTATRGPLPAETAAAMREADEWELRVGRVWDGRDEDVAQRSEEARAVIAALIGADPADVALTYGRDDAVALAQHAIGHGRMIDATHTAGAERLDVNTLNAEAVAFAADRWLLGPEGTGALWLADRRAASLSRTLPRTSLIGLARSVGWLEMYVGLEWIYERTAALVQRLDGALAAIPGVQLQTSPETPRAVISFRIVHWTSEQATEELSRRVHALLGRAPVVGAIVASVAWFNTEDELDRLAAAVAELAAHTPDSLPRRPTLIVLGEG